MCGIAGKFNYQNEEPVPESLIKAMTDRMIYRGPDADGHFFDGPVGLGHRRLSIIDLSELGRQPMKSKDGQVWITFNGEIYNYQQTRKNSSQRGICLEATQILRLLSTFIWNTVQIV